MAASITYGGSVSGGSTLSSGNVTLSGFNELQQWLSAFPVKLQNKVLRKAMREAAKPMLAQAKRNAPVGKSSVFESLANRTSQLGAALGATEKQRARAVKRTVANATRAAKKSGDHYPGQLRDSLKIRSIKRNRSGRVGVVIQTRAGDYKGKTFYGAFVEYGTSKMAAQPYMRPAFDTEAAGAIDIVAGVVRSELSRLATGSLK